MPQPIDEKKEPVVGGQEKDVEHGDGHLQELEVDVAVVLQEDGEKFDLDSDHSPYPEGAT